MVLPCSSERSGPPELSRAPNYVYVASFRLVIREKQWSTFNRRVDASSTRLSMASLQWDFSVKAVHLAECLHCESWCVRWVFGVLCESNLSIVTIVLCEPRAQLANSQRDARRRDEGIHQAHHAPTVPTLLAGEVLQRLQTNVSFLAAFVMPTNSVYLRVGRLSNIFILAQVYPILLERPPDFNGVTIVWQLGHWERNRLRPLWIRKAQFQPSKQKLLAKHCVFALFVKSSNLRHNLRLLDHNLVHTGCHKLFEISQIQKKSNFSQPPTR